MKALTNEEIKELLTITLHGSLPAKTMYRIFETLCETIKLREEKDNVDVYTITTCGKCELSNFDNPTSGYCEHPQLSEFGWVLDSYNELYKDCPLRKKDLVFKLKQKPHLPPIRVRKEGDTK